MELEKISILDILPSEYNPRKITNEEINKLSKSISEFGFVDPIIINLKNNKIIGGHQRYEVLKEEYEEDNETNFNLNLIKLGDIGWVFPDTDLKIKDDNHEKALNLALNRISGDWDLPKLEILIDELSLTDLDIHLTGFDDLELTEMNLESDLLFRESKESEEDEDLEDIYDEPVKEQLQCPFCDHIDVVSRFKKV